MRKRPLVIVIFLFFALLGLKTFVPSLCVTAERMALLASVGVRALGMGMPKAREATFAPNLPVSM